MRGRHPRSEDRLTWKGFVQARFIAFTVPEENSDSRFQVIQKQKVTNCTGLRKERPSSVMTWSHKSLVCLCIQIHQLFFQLKLWFSGLPNSKQPLYSKCFLWLKHQYQTLSFTLVSNWRQFLKFLSPCFKQKLSLSMLLLAGLTGGSTLLTLPSKGGLAPFEGGLVWKGTWFDFILFRQREETDFLDWKNLWS